VASFDFITDRPDNYEFDVQVMGDDGQILHSDHAVAIIPRG